MDADRIVEYGVAYEIAVVGAAGDIEPVAVVVGAIAGEIAVQES